MASVSRLIGVAIRVVNMLPVNSGDFGRVGDWVVRVGILRNYAASQGGSKISTVGNISIILRLEEDGE